VAKDVATTGKTIAEIPGVQAETSAKVALQKPMAPEHIATLAKSGVTVPEGTTYAQAEKLVDQQLKGQGVQIDWAKLALERDKVAAGKGTQNLDEAMKLRKEFQGHKTYQDTQAIASSLERIKSSTGNGPGDIAMLYSFMRLVDPGSTVREGEFATARNAGGVPGAILAAYNKAIGKGSLSPEVRAEFLAEAEKLFRAQLQRQERHRNEYERLARKAGFDPVDVIGVPEGGAATGSTPTPDPLGIRQ